MLAKERIKELLEEKKQLDKEITDAERKLYDLSLKDRQLKEVVEKDLDELVSLMKEASISQIEKRYTIVLNVNLKDEAYLRVGDSRNAVLYKNIVKTNNDWVWSKETKEVSQVLTNWNELKDDLCTSLSSQLSMDNQKRKNQLRDLNSTAERKERFIKQCAFDNVDVDTDYGYDER